MVIVWGAARQLFVAIAVMVYTWLVVPVGTVRVPEVLVEFEAVTAPGCQVNPDAALLSENVALPVLAPLQTIEVTELTEVKVGVVGGFKNVLNICEHPLLVTVTW